MLETEWQVIGDCEESIEAAKIAYKNPIAEAWNAWKDAEEPVRFFMLNRMSNPEEAILAY